MTEKQLFRSHRLMDETFASALNAHIEGWSAPDALLTYLVLSNDRRAKKSERLQLLNFDDSAEILRNHPDLEEAVKERRWSTVRSHREFASSFRLQSPYPRSCIAIAGKAA